MKKSFQIQVTKAHLNLAKATHRHPFTLAIADALRKFDAKNKKRA